MSRQLLKEIEITEMKGLSIGNVQNAEAKTGVTVLYLRSWTGRCGSKTGCPDGL